MRRVQVQWQRHPSITLRIVLADRQLSERDEDHQSGPPEIDMDIPYIIIIVNEVSFIAFAST